MFISIVILYYIFVPALQGKNGEYSGRLINSRKQSPTSLTEVGRISGPEPSSRRRCQETLKVAQALHGATPDNMLPAYEGIIAALNTNCSVPINQYV